MVKRRDYKELSKDEAYIKVVENLDESLDQIEESFKLIAPILKNDDLTISEQIKLDNYLIYSVNSLYWIYLKMQGEDPNQVRNLLKHFTFIIFYKICISRILLNTN